LAHEVNPPANDIFGTPLTRNDSSGDFFEMTEAQGLDNFACTGVTASLAFGTKRRADDGAGSAAAFGLTHEPSHARNDYSDALGLQQTFSNGYTHMLLNCQ
jgi:hypothetical protein